MHSQIRKSNLPSPNTHSWAHILEIYQIFYPFLQKATLLPSFFYQHCSVHPNPAMLPNPHVRPTLPFPTGLSLSADLNSSWQMCGWMRAKGNMILQHKLIPAYFELILCSKIWGSLWYSRQRHLAHVGSSTKRCWSKSLYLSEFFPLATRTTKVMTGQSPYLIFYRAINLG